MRHRYLGQSLGIVGKRYVLCVIRRLPGQPLVCQSILYCCPDVRIVAVLIVDGSRNAKPSELGE